MPAVKKDTSKWEFFMSRNNKGVLIPGIAFFTRNEGRGGRIMQDLE